MSLDDDPRKSDIAVQHAARLQAVTAGLAAAATTAEIADVIITHGIPALRARTGILGVLETSDELTFVRSVGYADVFPERLKLDEPWPITTAARNRKLIELRDLPERRQAFAVPEHVWAASGHGTLVAVPLVVRDRVVGALGFTREESTALTADERLLVETLAGLAAQALDRAALYEADRRARLQAEGLQRVASAVSTAATMDEVADAVASEALAVLDASGVTVAVARADDAGVADVLASRGSVEAHAARQPIVQVGSDTVTAAAIRREAPVYVESPEELEAAWPASAGVARELGVGAIASVPFRLHDRRGAVSVVVHEPRRFLPEERTFLELLARTCEQGLLRAALYDAEQEARRRADILNELAATLSGAVEIADVGRAFLEHALGHLGASSGSLMLPDADRTTLTAAAVGGEARTRDRWLLSMPVDGQYVIATAFRLRAPVAVPTRAELESRFPGTVDRFGDDARAAYAGPLAIGGEMIGAFGLVFAEERAVSADDARLLATMADLCAQAIERARLYESEHGIADRLQQALLPDAVVRRPGIEVAARYEASSAAMAIGGDWWDTVALPDGRVGVAVGDVVGHGIEAAATMGRLRSAFAAYALESASPSAVLSRLDRFAAGPGGVEFATACYAVLDPRTGALTYSSAGHPPMLVLAPGGGCRWLEDGRGGPLLGDPEFSPPEASCVLEPGALLLLYSDGLVERRGERLDVGLARLEEVLESLRDRPVEELCVELVERLRAPSTRPDDVVVVALRRTAA